MEKVEQGMNDVVHVESMAITKHDRNPDDQSDPTLKIQKCGPWGNPCQLNGQYNWKMELGDEKTVKAVIIQSGFIVDGIGFVVSDKTGITTSLYFGGSGGGLREIALKPDEYITQISGKHGVYEYGYKRHIASIKIHTNLCPAGYGPYGKDRASLKLCRFSSPPPASDYAISGFYGRYGVYLDCIGVFRKRV